MKKRSIHIIITLENIFIKIKGNTLLYILQNTLKNKDKSFHKNVRQDVIRAEILKVKNHATSPQHKSGPM